MKFLNQKGKQISLDLVSAIQENKNYLSEVDGLIGDGDHGINMNKGFTMYESKVADIDLSLSESLQILGKILLESIGGSMGPLYGSMFIHMSKVSKDEDEINQEVFGKMLQSALEAVKRLGNANVGDKTLVDVLEPAVNAYFHVIAEGGDFLCSLDAMKSAAITGKDSTKDMVARLGRASRLGERSRGVLDAGAVSCCIILCTMADSIRTLLI